MDFKEVDRLPNYELPLWSQTVDRWYAEGLSPNDVDFHDWFEGEDYFQLDRRAYANVRVDMMPAFDEEVFEEDDRYVVSRHPDGIVTKALKEGSVRGMRLSMDQYLTHPVTDRASFLDMKRRYNPDAPVRYPFWWDEQVERWRNRDYPVFLLANGTIGLYSQLRSWVGTVEISYLFYDDPDLVQEMIDLIVDFTLRVTRKARREVQFDYFSFFEDMAGKGGPLISPSLFRKFLSPAYKKIIEGLRQDGIRHFWLDCDGDPRSLIPLMLEAGITCLWPLEVASGMDPVALRKEYGTDLVLCGGIDKREIAKGRKAIDRELYAKIPALLERGGYIPFMDHAIPPDISLDDFKYYMDLKMKLIGM
jgi:hypothetical protein